jgi:hypothetical protein
MGQFGPAKRLIVETTQDLVAEDYLAAVGRDFVVSITRREVPFCFSVKLPYYAFTVYRGALS